MNLIGKIAVVTGANKGIGMHCVNQLLEKGAIVYGICRSGCSTNHKNYTCIRADVQEFNQLEKAFISILEKHDEIHVLINNAGIGITGPIEETSDKEIKSAFQTNLFGPIEMIKKCIHITKQQ